MRIGFFPNMKKENIRDILSKAITYCHDHGIEVYMPKELEHHDVCQLGIEKENLLPRPDIFEHLDMACSFGGDGTIIQLARQIYPYNVPICGVNLGELGFLNQIELESLESSIARISKGDYYVEDRIHLVATLQTAEGDRILRPIINDIVVSRAEPGKMARINLSINGGHTQMYPADGLIVSSSTGSTGYNLSAGGPIMAPDNRSIIVTPIAPHLLQGVSLVLKESAKIDITMPERQKSLHISIDGTFDYDFNNTDSLHVEAHPQYCKYVRFKDQKFFATLFKKLNARSKEVV